MDIKEANTYRQAMAAKRSTSIGWLWGLRYGVAGGAVGLYDALAA